MIPKLERIIKTLPVLKEEPWGKDLPAIYRVFLEYGVPLTKEVFVEPMIGYIFGKSSSGGIYFHYLGRRRKNSSNILAPNVGRPLLDPEFIERISEI